MSLYKYILGRLSERFPAGEARSMTLLLLERMCGMTCADALTDMREVDEFGEKGRALSSVVDYVCKGVPLQYAMGEAEFDGMWMKVGEGVLIPRPETEELVRWASECGSGVRSIIDIGTGSGCIAVAMARRITEAHVEAWDISDYALAMTGINAKAQAVEVAPMKVDVLHADNLQHDRVDMIISNPPYICNSEKEEMEALVLDNEPHLALFVPDDNPLLFYETIATLGCRLLNTNGLLFFEINRRFGSEICDMLMRLGYADVELRKDQYGNDRMVKAVWKQ